MTRKDYVLIAAALKATYRPQLVDDHTRGINDGVAAAAESLAIELKRDNPRFDRERFLKAAGVACE